jgi:uncharacterized membrane protein YheB (UPF0754 family)
MNKSLGTNIVSFLVVVLGILFDNNIILTVGLFALSGAITNWLAIHMLFEKVPFLYGSGVVENRFEQFKVSIHTLIMDQFFTKENLNKFFSDELNQDKNIDLTQVIEKTDFSIAFDSLKEAVMESGFGGMLGMFGGEKALEPLKDPFTKKMKSSILAIAATQSFQQTLKQSLSTTSISDDIYDKLSNVVNKRLDELTPKMVKDVVQQMIKEHLGWLIVWGGVFGGLIGLVSSFLV